MTPILESAATVSPAESAVHCGDRSVSHNATNGGAAEAGALCDSCTCPGYECASLVRVARLREPTPTERASELAGYYVEDARP